MIAVEKQIAKLLSLVLFSIGLSLAQIPDTTADSLKQLRDVTVKRTPPGAGDYVHYCAFCHGSEGKGDGLNAFNLKIRPRDFTDTISMRGKTSSNVENVIRAGGAANKLSADMPPWGKTLDSINIAQLCEYVMWLAGAGGGRSSK